MSNFASRNRISQSIFQDFLEYFSELSEDLQIEAVAVFFLEFGPTLIERERQKKQQIRRTTLAAVSYWRFKHVKKAPIAVCVSPAVPLPPTSLFGNTIFSKGHHLTIIINTTNISIFFISIFINIEHLMSWPTRRPCDLAADPSQLMLMILEGGKVKKSEPLKNKTRQR